MCVRVYEGLCSLHIKSVIFVPEGTQRDRDRERGMLSHIHVSSAKENAFIIHLD